MKKDTTHHEIIEMAWADEVSFDAIEFHTGLSTDTDSGSTTGDGQGHVLVKMLIDGTSVTSQNQEWGHSAYGYADTFIYNKETSYLYWRTQVRFGNSWC